jgi:hypothetical protein
MLSIQDKIKEYKKFPMAAIKQIEICNFKSGDEYLSASPAWIAIKEMLGEYSSQNIQV